MFLTNFFNWNVLDRVFCIELEDYRLFQLGSIILRSIGKELRKRKAEPISEKVFEP